MIHVIFLTYSSHPIPSNCRGTPDHEIIELEPNGINDVIIATKADKLDGEPTARDRRKARERDEKLEEDENEEEAEEPRTSKGAVSFIVYIQFAFAPEPLYERS